MPRPLHPLPRTVPATRMATTLFCTLFLVAASGSAGSGPGFRPKGGQAAVSRPVAFAGPWVQLPGCGPAGGGGLSACRKGTELQGILTGPRPLLTGSSFVETMGRGVAGIAGGRSRMGSVLSSLEMAIGKGDSGFSKKGGTQGSPGSRRRKRTGSPQGLKWARSGAHGHADQSSAGADAILEDVADRERSAANATGSFGAAGTKEGGAKSLQAQMRVASSTKNAQVARQAAEMTKRRLFEKQSLRVSQDSSSSSSSPISSSSSSSPSSSSSSSLPSSAEAKNRLGNSGKANASERRAGSPGSGAREDRARSARSGSRSSSRSRSGSRSSSRSDSRTRSSSRGSQGHQHPQHQHHAEDGRPQIRIPRNLTSHSKLHELLDLLQPFAEGEPGHVVTAADSVGAMNRIKRLSGRGHSSDARAEYQMRKFARIAVANMDHMSGKYVGLAVNAASSRGKDSKDYSALMHAASKRAVQLAKHSRPSPWSLDVAAVSMIVNGFAKQLHRDDHLFKALAGFMVKSAFSAGFEDDVNAQSVSVIVNAYAKLGVREPALFKLMSDIAQRIPPNQFSSQAVANILNAYARQGMRGHNTRNLFMYLSNVIQGMDSGAFQSQHIAIILNAFSKLEMRDDELFEFLLGEVLERDVSAFDVQALANILNAYARIYGPDADPRVFSHVARLLMSMPVKAYDAQNLASLLNSFSKVEQPDEALFRHISKTLQRMDSLLFDAQAVSNVVHSFAKAEIHDEALFSAMSNVALSMNYMFEGQSVALILNAYSRLEIMDPALMLHMSKVVRRIPSDTFEVQHVETILNAFARMENRDQRLFEYLADIVMRFQPCDFDPQAIAIMLNSYAKVMPTARVTIRVFNFFSNDVFPSLPMGSFHPTAVSIILNAFAKVDMRNEGVFRFFARDIRSLGPEHFDGHTMSNLFHAFAKVDVRDGPTLRHLVSHLVDMKVTDLRPEEVAVIAWSAAVLRNSDPRLTQFLLDGIDAHVADMETNFLRQAHQYLLTCELDGLLDLHCAGENGHDLDLIKLRSRASPLQVCDYLGRELAVCRQAFCSIAPESTRKSRLQGEVVEALRSMGLSVTEEYIDPHSGYSIDIMVAPTDFHAAAGLKQVAIEVDGPSHYAVGSRVKLGATVMKHRHMEQLGFNMKSVPYWEWDALGTDDEKVQYLTRVLSHRGMEFELVLAGSKDDSAGLSF